MEKNYRIYRYTNILNGMKYHGRTCRKYQSGGVGAPGTHPIRSDEWKKKQSESHKGKRVCQYSKDGEFLAEYPSFHEASRQTGATKECISRCCVGKIKTAGGYVWSLSN